MEETKGGKKFVLKRRKNRKRKEEGE